MPDVSKPWYTFTCNECHTAWCGLKTCHCTACHETFTSITGFDRHRVGGHCQHPSSVGLVLMGRDYPCWGLPSGELSPRDRRALAARGYDDENRCRACGSHIADPHAPECPAGERIAG